MVSSLRILLPDGVEVGTAIRHAELWAKAFSQASSTRSLTQSFQADLSVDPLDRICPRQQSSCRKSNGSDLQCMVRRQRCYVASYADRPAVLQELQQHVQRRLGSGKSKPRKMESAEAAAPAVELRVRVLDAAFVMLHHPLEVRCAARLSSAHTMLQSDISSC